MVSFFLSKRPMAKTMRKKMPTIQRSSVDVIKILLNSADKLREATNRLWWSILKIVRTHFAACGGKGLAKNSEPKP